jgi:hypothetical protein
MMMKWMKEERRTGRQRDVTRSYLVTKAEGGLRLVGGEIENDA